MARRMTAAQALIRYLSVQHSERDGERRRLIPATFGIFGHGNVAGIGQALDEVGSEMRFYQPKNEQSMVHTALGFAKAVNRLSTLACSASIGPGSTNLVTGAATATVNRLPVLLLPGDTFATRHQGPVLQQLEASSAADLTVNDTLRPVSVYFDRISRPEQLLTALPEAMRALLDPAATGAVTIALHQDVQGEVYDYPESFFEPRTWTVPRRPATIEELERAVALLRAAERPLIIAGGGVRYSAAESELVAFADALGIPVAETSAGKGVGSGARLALGGIGVNGTRAANEIAARADLVVCVGTRLTDFTTGSHSLFANPEVRFVGVNVCAPDAHKLGAEAVVADAKVALESLRALLDDGSPVAYRDEAKKAIGDWRRELADDAAERDGERMSQLQVLRALNAAAGERDWVVAAAGSPPGDLLKAWDCAGSARAHIEFGFSCMGHELPAGLGIRMADEDAGEIYVVIGDGTYLMAPTELVTANQEGLKVTMVLIVNGGYQSIHSLQRQTTGSSFGTEFRRPDEDGRLDGEFVAVDYAANVRSFGVECFEADDLGSLDAAIRAAREVEGPAAIVVRVEPRRGVVGTDAWWDLGIAAASGRERQQQIAVEHDQARASQRFYY
jgi:3D-(3,5/4)-trihydroxycyclohexane-1,2-dione acylhydrolase (decyclizing)